MSNVKKKTKKFKNSNENSLQTRISAQYYYITITFHVVLNKTGPPVMRGESSVCYALYTSPFLDLFQKPNHSPVFINFQNFYKNNCHFFIWISILMLLVSPAKYMNTSWHYGLKICDWACQNWPLNWVKSSNLTFVAFPKWLVLSTQFWHKHFWNLMLYSLYMVISSMMSWLVKS